MISLALRGKLPVTEDPLTAAFADLLRYEARPDVLRAVLEKSRPHVVGATIPLEFDAFSIELWPILEGREPDVRIELKLAGKLVARLIIEAKLGAEKSGTGEIDSYTQSGDQLGYYLLHEAARLPACRTPLLYLTHHGAMPKASLAESANQLHAKGRGDLASELFWLSWHEVHGVLQDAPVKSQMVADVLLLLGSVRMSRFQTFQARIRLGALNSAYFYKAVPTKEHPKGGCVDTAASLGSLGSQSWSYRRGFVRPRYDWRTAPKALGSSTFLEERT